MAHVEQIYTIVNSLAKQAFGETAIQVTNAQTFIALGDFVLSSDTNVDLYTKALVDRIGKTIFSMREYNPDYDSVVRKPFDYGLILQKIYVDMPDADANPSWLIGEDDYKPEYAPVIKPTVKQKLFNNLTTFEIDITIPDRIWQTAFTSATQMGAMISAVFMAVDNRIKTALDDTVNFTRASFIARKLQSNKPCCAINLLDDYNTLTGQAVTVANCMRDMEFLKYASMMINLWANRMRKMSVLFNDDGYKRHTPKDLQVVTILDEFASATNTYLQADTYHKELVSLPMFKTVPYWQGSGLTYAFEDTSKISVQLDETTTVTKSGIIAVIYDWEALGVMIDRRVTTSDHNNRAEYTSYYNKVERGQFNDMSENGIVFYVDDTAEASANVLPTRKAKA